MILDKLSCKHPVNETTIEADTGEINCGICDIKMNDCPEAIAFYMHSGTDERYLEANPHSECLIHIKKGTTNGSK